MKTPTKSLLNVFGSLLIFVVVAFSIAINSFKNGKFTCNKYTLNTYLYIILTFNIIAILCLSLEHNKINYNINIWQLLGIFLVTIVLLISLNFIKVDNIVLKHLVWLLFVLGIGVIFFPMYNSLSDKSVVLSAAFTTIMLTISLSIIAYIKPDWISLSIGPILFILLVGGLIMEISLLIIYRKNYSKISNIFRLTSYFFIAIFMGYILYDTKMLQIRAKECVKADYIQESLHLFLDIFNIFVRMIAIR
jgi:FtsH-binding integral membrane protein